MPLSGRVAGRVRALRPELDEEAIWRTALAGAASLFLVIGAVAVLLPLRDRLDTGTVALVLLLPPLVATYGGRGLSLVLALVSALCFNFFFTVPYNSFRIESTASVAAFAVYILVCLVVAAIVGRFRRASRIAEARSRDTSLLQDLTVELIRHEELAPTIRSTLIEVADGLELRGAALHAVTEGVVVDAEAGDASRAAELLASLGRPAVPTLVNLRGQGGMATIPILTRDAVYGFVIADSGGRELERESIRVLESYGGVVGLALARARLQQEGVRRQALEETDRLRQALLQSVSHDLRTPLTAIKALAYSLHGHAPDAEHEEIVGEIEQQSDRLFRLVGAMLDLSRIEGGALRPQASLMPVDELVHAAVAAGRAATEGRRVEIDVAEDLPAVSVDETMLRQVLVNLLENAAHADESGGPVTVRAVQLRPDRLAIAVIDHGPGVPEPERRRIFEPYYRLRPAPHRPGGTGLGLALSRGFVEAHGGLIRVEPTPGGGATFVVELPLLPSPASLPG